MKVTRWSCEVAEDTLRPTVGRCIVGEKQDQENGDWRKWKFNNARGFPSSFLGRIPRTGIPGQSSWSPMFGENYASGKFPTALRFRGSEGGWYSGSEGFVR